MCHLLDQRLVVRELGGAAALDGPSAGGKTVLQPGILVDEDRHARIGGQVLEVHAAGTRDSRNTEPSQSNQIGVR